MSPKNDERHCGRLFLPPGHPQRTHQRTLLANDARAIASYKQYEFAEDHREVEEYDGHVYFVPDDTLLTDEARGLGIKGSSDFFGGAVPYIFVKTKSITHPLVDEEAARPNGGQFPLPLG
jgi:uncharacterized protein DUF3182